MEFKQIKELIDKVNKSEISELKIESENFKILIRSKHYTEAVNQAKSKVTMAVPAAAPVAAAPVQAAAAAAPATSAAAPSAASDSGAKEEATASNLVEEKAPMIGTFYRSPGPDKAPFVKVGDSVSKGDTICIIEAMKLFNEIESEQSGTIVKILIDDASPVEYDQPMFLIEPN